MKNKIGIGIVTVNREHFFKKCIKTLPDADYVVIIHNGERYKCFDKLSKKYEVVSLPEKQSVAKNKNIALKKMMENGCDHLFLCEDDIYFSKKDLCERYIKCAEKTGIWHLNYGGHGFYNKNPQTGLIQPRKVIEYNSDTKIDLYYNILGAWSYYHKAVIHKVGYMDEGFVNAMEHVDHTYQIIKMGNMHPPFWWFADLHESYKYIHDIEENHGGSEIRDENFMETLKNGCLYFKEKNEYMPTEVPQTEELQVYSVLRKLSESWKKRKL